MSQNVSKFESNELHVSFRMFSDLGVQFCFIASPFGRGQALQSSIAGVIGILAICQMSLLTRGAFGSSHSSPFKHSIRILPS